MVKGARLKIQATRLGLESHLMHRLVGYTNLSFLAQLADARLLTDVGRWFEPSSDVHLAQLVERKTFNLVVAGSSPAVDNLY